MITVNQIRGGGAYLGRHLKANDYWAEGEEVEGKWLGQGAARLGLEGSVRAEEFEALGENRDPRDGEQLTTRARADRVSWHDFQISAPKDVSVLGVLGDERVREAFTESVRQAHGLLEEFAAARVRTGESVNTEDQRLTGNLASAVYFHDANRNLEPQLHAHLVTANATWDNQANSWRALQPAEMARASLWVRQAFFEDLSQRLEKLGYQTQDHDRDGFSIVGMEGMAEVFSSRRAQIDAAREAFRKEHGRLPTAKETAVLTRETRADKLAKTSTEAVRANQRLQLKAAGFAKPLEVVVATAKGRGEVRRVRASVTELLEAGIAHLFERKSQVSRHELLAAAMEARGEKSVDVFALQGAVSRSKELVARGDLFTTQEVLETRKAIARHVNSARGTSPALADADQLDPRLSASQRQAATALARSRDRVTLFIGDAGTGKTFTIQALREAAADGQHWIALGSTTGARDALQQEGFGDARTLQGFLASKEAQSEARGKTIVLDEAGLVGDRDMKQLLDVARAGNSRVLLVGDHKQHASVLRGEALRDLQQAGATTARLSEVRRQLDPAHKELASMMAKAVESGQMGPALDQAEALGLISEHSNEPELYGEAVAAYVRNEHAGVASQVIAPTWSSVERFTSEARDQLRQKGVLRGEDHHFQTLRPESWTKAEQRQTHRYEPGAHHLTFHRSMAGMKAGSVAQVVGTDASTGTLLLQSQAKTVPIPASELRHVTVSKKEEIQLAPGDKILLLANDRASKLSNGSVRRIEKIEGSKIFLEGGRFLNAAQFQAFTHGHAVTSYKAQGSTHREVIAVLDRQTLSSPAANPRQLYVDSTRHRESLHVFTADKQLLGHAMIRGHANQRQANVQHLKKIVRSKSKSPAPEHQQQAARQKAHQQEQQMRQAQQGKDRGVSIGL